MYFFKCITLIDVSNVINILSNTKLKGIGINQTHLYGFILLIGNKDAGINNLRFTGEIISGYYSDLIIEKVLLLGNSSNPLIQTIYSATTTIKSPKKIKYYYNEKC